MSEHSGIKGRIGVLSGLYRDKTHPLPKILIAFLTILLVSFLFPTGETLDYSQNAGGIWTDNDLIAPFAFPVLKDSRIYEKEKAEAAKGVFPVFTRDEQIGSLVIDSLQGTMLHLIAATDARLKAGRTHNTEDSIAVAAAMRKVPFVLTDREWMVLSGWRQAESRKVPAPLQSMRENLKGFLSDILRFGVMDREDIDLKYTAYALRNGTREEIVPIARVFDRESGLANIEMRIISLFGEEEAGQIAMKVVRSVLRPNLIFSQSDTDRLVQIAQENIPRTVGYVEKGERIIGQHERVTDENRLRLESFQRAKSEREVIQNGWKHRLGVLLHVTLVIGLFGLYLYFFRKKLYADNSRLLIIALLIVLESLLAYCTIIVDIPQPIQFLIVIPVASMLLTIIFDSRVSFYGTVMLAFLIAGIRGNDYVLALTLLAGGALGAFTVRDLRNRRQIFQSLGFIFLGFAIPILAAGLEELESFSIIRLELMYALINAVASPVITYGMLIFFERGFRVTTDLTLLELSDFNHPLLRQLSEAAPGTFHHSMMLGTLAEAAAEDIGANPILAKVGAYYHDIGKIEKPEYFVENQIGSHSRHTRLRPHMSALIISSHVKEGIEIARKYALPEKVIDFIPQHHGTTRISYFYDKALKQAAKRPPKDAIREENFRYPGPKPQSKEAGIVMLADSVEASTRALTIVSPLALESAIDIMVKQRFTEGQLDECDLTLRDLTKIKEAFLKILLGIHHQRITYPEATPEQTVTEPAQPVAESPAPEPTVTASESPVAVTEGNEEQAPEEMPRDAASGAAAP